MADMPKPTSRLGYPFDAKDNKPFTDAQPIYEALAAAVGGHFPLGSNGHFHGGIHIDRSEAHIFDIDNGVKCLADGEIVAYRLDKRYPDATPSAGTASEGEAASDQKVALRPYSTGFVLVRHLLQVPALPSPVSEDGGAQTLTVLDYGTPLAARENGPTIGWVPMYARVALLDMLGNWVKVRILPPSVATWTNESVDEPWLRIRSLDNVPNSLPNRWFGGEPLTATVVLPSQPPPAPPPADTPAPGPSTPPPSLVLYSLYMHLADGATYDAKPNIPRPKWWPKTLYRAGNKTTNKWTLNGELILGLMVRTAPVSANGNEIGILVRESEIEVEPIAGNPRWGVVRNIISGRVATRPDGVRITSLPATGYVFLKELDEFRTPEVFDSIEIPTVPIPINMGDVIGHIGQQVSSCETLIAGQPTSRPTLHLEVFSAQDVPAFLRDSRRYADKLPERYWTLIRLHKGDPVKAEPKDGAPSVTTMASDRTIAVTHNTTIQKDDQDQNWVYVKVHDADGSQVVGWAKDKDRRSTPWHWPGFEVVDAASNDAGTWWEGTAQVFVDFLRGGPRPMETPFFKQIRQLVDSNQDGRLSEEERDSALKDRAAARRLGGLIAYHSSEWHVPSWASKYGVISDIAMTLGKKAMDSVKAEKDCVMRLRWWDEVAMNIGLPQDAKVYHFHPIGLAGNLGQSTCIPLSEVLEIALRVSGGYEGRGNLDYHSLADDFDSQGTSFGLIQWNFGQGTLGPVLLRMYQVNSIRFAACFPKNTDYETLREALINGNRTAQLAWAKSILQSNRTGWRQAFNSIGDVEQFQEIQLEEAAKYQNNVKRCIAHMRAIRPDLMREVSVLAYVALYDLSVQQNGLDKNSTISNIEQRVVTENPQDQIEFLKICVQERAKTASSQWAADAMSRRMGIIEGRSHAVTLFGHSANRGNRNFELLENIKDYHVCNL